MKLSIVIPVYGVEATLDRCIESVIGQSYSEFEVILVDDGSPDNCPRLCDEWAERDERIRVIHKPNGGLSDARNAGIEIAKGDYITFVDSDDYLDEDTYRQLMATMSAHPDYDILEYPVCRSSNSGQTLLLFEDSVYKDMNDYWLKGHAYEHTYAWNKIYKSRLFADVKYPVGYVFEDAFTLPRLLKQAKVVATTTAGLYHYTQNAMGITAQANGKQLRMLLEAHLQSGMPIDDRYYMHLLNIQCDVYELTGDSPILPNRHVSPRKLTKEPKLMLKAIAVNLIGINNLCKISKTIHKYSH